MKATDETKSELAVLHGDPSIIIIQLKLDSVLLYGWPFSVQTAIQEAVS